MSSVAGDVVDLGAVCGRCGTSRGVTVVATTPTSSGPDHPVYGCAQHAVEVTDRAAEALANTEALAHLHRLGADHG
ncbi:hypothetical protein [Streptomyces sp. NPDC047315]|uniref:hypothetical protein n=1 Tax=Streptomyces sp. NPDC047315 TaxID=3155142 RepID=UPI0033F39E1A